MSGQIAEHWPLTTLGEISEVITKGTTPTSVGFQFVDSGVNFVKIESITLDGKIIENKLAKITSECHEKLKRSQLHEGDILFSIAGALGRTCMVTKEVLPANTNQALAIVRLKPLDTIYPQYILRALSTGFALDQIEKFRGGAAQQNLSLTQMKAFQLPLPPIEEQKRIVKIIDETFQSTTHAKEISRNRIIVIEELEKTILSKVFSGEL